MKHILKSRCSINCRPNFDTKLRHPQCRSLLGIPTKLRPNFDSTLRCRSLIKMCICFDSNCVYYLFKIVDICCSKLWNSYGQNCEYCLTQIVNICWSKLWYLLIKIVNILWSRLCVFLKTIYCFSMIIIYTVRVLTSITIICIIYVSK